MFILKGKITIDDQRVDEILFSYDMIRLMVAIKFNGIYVFYIGEHQIKIESDEDIFEKIINGYINDSRSM